MALPERSPEGRSFGGVKARKAEKRRAGEPCSEGMGEEQRRGEKKMRWLKRRGARREARETRRQWREEMG